LRNFLTSFCLKVSGRDPNYSKPIHFEKFGREAIFSTREHRVGFWIEQLDSRRADAIFCFFDAQ
jgi:hypothetical protein